MWEKSDEEVHERLAIMQNLADTRTPSLFLKNVDLQIKMEHLHFIRVDPFGKLVA